MNCKVCADYGVETPATTHEQEIDEFEGDLYRTGEKLPMCDYCAKQSRHYPVRQEGSASTS